MLRLPVRLRATHWHEGAVALARGPLVYALRIGERWEQVPNEDRYGPYRACYPAGPWNYGLPERSLSDLDAHFEFVEDTGELAANPWSLDGAPIEIHTIGHRIDSWRIVNQTADPMPQSPVSLEAEAEAEPIVLIPFGCTTLRIAEFPVVRKAGED